MQNLLITGGLGYIGSKFIENFSNLYNIFVLDTCLYEEKNTEKYNLINKDIRELNPDDIKNIDFVVHMAELSNDPLGELSDGLTEEINHVATKNLLEICNLASVKKFIYMSSCAVYGKNDNLVNELSELSPLTNYSKSKVANERYIKANDFNFEIIIFRNATVFGYSKNHRLDLVINELCYEAYANSEINLLSDGTPKRPFIHVLDLVNIINEFLISNKNYHKEIFNVGSNELNFSIKEVALAIGDQIKTEKITFGEKDEDQRSYFVDFTKLNDTLSGYKMQFDLKSGIKDLLKNYEFHDFDKNKKRIKKINYLLDKKMVDENLLWL